MISCSWLPLRRAPSLELRSRRTSAPSSVASDVWLALRSMSGWTTAAAEVLVFECVEERLKVRGRLHYFLKDGTAAVVTVGQRAPTAFRLGDGPEERAPLYRDGSSRRLKPTDLELGGKVALGEREWVLVDGDEQAREYFRRFGRPLGRRVAVAGVAPEEGDSRSGGL